MSDSGYTPSTESVRIAFGYVDESTPEIYEARVEAFDLWLASHAAAIRTDERKLQAERDAVIVEKYWDKEISPRLFQIARSLVKAIRGQSFTGTEKT